MPAKTYPALVKYPVKIILFSGLLVGTLDISSAFIDYYISSGKNPLLILPYIASGAFGKSALSGGALMMLMGLLFHYIIAFSFTLFFFWLCANTRILPVSWVPRGVLYGIFIWLIMNLVVVQLSGAPHSTISAMKAGKILKSSLILIFMIGLPLSFIAHRYRPNIFIEEEDPEMQAL